MGRWAILAAILACSSSVALAEPLFPAGAYPALDQTMARHHRQFYELNAAPFGLSLNGHIPPLSTPDGAAARGLIDAFLAQDAELDFQTHSGKHPFEVIATYGEHGDLGFFGGVALLGTAFEYMTLKRDGASAEALAASRARVVRAVESWHIFYVVTGGGGLVARGIRRVVPEDPSDPPIPDPTPDFIPLFGADGKPLPAPKDNGSERADASDGALPPGTWTWIDSCSKDQLSGQVLGMVALYEAIKDDPDIDQALVTRMQADARGVGEMLMQKRELLGLETAASLSPGTLYDLIIMDADRRATFFHDLNPFSLEKVYVDPEGGTFNMFNVVMAWGIIKGLHHITGDERLEAFLYDDLLDERAFPAKITDRDAPGVIDYMYAGLKTNFDVPDMTGVVLFLALWLEKDPAVTAPLHDYLEHAWWLDPGESRTARLAKQPLWHALYLAVTARGTDPVLVAELADLLEGFTLGPYWETARTNCDEAEIAARECLAIDGKTTLVLEGQAPNGRWLATEALHPSIRPTSDFNARSNSFEVNGGGGGDKLNPGGDLMAAYWMARYFQARPPGQSSLAKSARDHMPIGGAAPVADPGPEPAAEPTPEAAPDASAEPGPDAGPTVEGEIVAGGGGCAGGGATHGLMFALLAALLALAARRREVGVGECQRAGRQ